jgi:hypothetical protein
MSAAGGATYVALAKPAAPDHPLAVEVSSRRIDHFDVKDPSRRRFGSLVFDGGLELRSPYSGFGGFSGLCVSTDGRDLVAISDAAQWLRARLVEENGRPAALAEARMGPLLDRAGRPLMGNRADTESLAMAGSVAYVGLEIVNEVLRFEGPDPLLARGAPIPVPAGVKRLSRGTGLEALAAPQTGPLAGSLIGIAEEGGDGAYTPGFLILGPRQGEFRLKTSADFDPTDLAPLPDGDLLLLERRFTLLGGVAMRMRRLRAADVMPGATIDGPVIAEADMAYEIDNMEGLAVHRGADGALRVTLISDDNFSLLQRTLLLRFRLEA